MRRALLGTMEGRDREAVTAGVVSGARRLAAASDHAAAITPAADC
jgi:hypothetical protein